MSSLQTVESKGLLILLTLLIIHIYHWPDTLIHNLDTHHNSRLKKKASFLAVTQNLYDWSHQKQSLDQPTPPDSKIYVNMNLHSKIQVLL